MSIALQRLVVAVAVCSTVAAPAGQQAGGASSETKRWNDLTSRVFGSDKTWEWIPAIDNRPGPIVPSAKRFLLGGWRKTGSDIFVSVSIDVVDNVKDAEQFLAIHEKAVKDWTVKRLQIGDGAWRLEHATGQVQIAVRRRLYLISLSSKDAALMERAAAQIVLYLDSIAGGANRRGLSFHRKPL